MNKKSGFTLAEVLITLMIIGVIAAMTIPSLMQTTARQEYVAALKKSISTVNQALALNYALEGIGSQEEPDLGFMTRRMNVTDTTARIDSGFYTSDGIYYYFDGDSLITVDVNGAKKPNRVVSGTGDSLYIGDVFTLTLDSTRNVVRAEGPTAEALYQFKD